MIFSLQTNDIKAHKNRKGLQPGSYSYRFSLEVLSLKHRFTFIISGLVSGILGYLIWLEWLGPVILH